jgi:glucose/arabinose dehydrogenase
MKYAVPIFSAVMFVALLTACSPEPVNGDLTAVRVAEGFDKPTSIAQFPTDHDRFLVLEQTSGLIREFGPGAKQPSLYVDLSDRVSSRGGEQGLFSLVFHPQFEQNGYLYLSYSDKETDATVVSRFEADVATGTLDPQSERILLAVDQPTRIHNGGMLAFGPDGYLYFGTGDGGGSDFENDPSQRLDTLLGKLLRIDVDHGDPYAIPPDNPFVDEPDARDEIWAYGLRNPWRFSFDRDTGDLYMGDVGGQKWEEINFQPAGSPGGENYGWSIAEGFQCREPDPDDMCGTLPGFTPPIHDYEHGLSRAVTGGYVYRGAALGQDYHGLYFFGDFITGQIWTFRYDGQTLSELIERTAELAPAAPDAIGMIPSFFEDADGELYIVDFAGQVFKIVLGEGGGGGGFNWILFIEGILNAVFPGFVDLISFLIGFLASLFGF